VCNHSKSGKEDTPTITPALFDSASDLREVFKKAIANRIVGFVSMILLGA
jgi:hypothetical protein